MASKSSPKNSPSREERRAARETRIVDVVVALAEEGGFEAVRSRAICERAEVTMGTLYRHFSSIEEILLFALARDFKVLEADFPDTGIPGGTAQARLGLFFRGLIDTLAERPLFARAVVRAIASGQSKALERVGDLDAMLQRYIEAAWLGVGPSGQQGQRQETKARKTTSCAFRSLAAQVSESVFLLAVSLDGAVIVLKFHSKSNKNRKQGTAAATGP